MRSACGAAVVGSSHFFDGNGNTFFRQKCQHPFPSALPERAVASDIGLQVCVFAINAVSQNMQLRIFFCTDFNAGENLQLRKCFGSLFAPCNAGNCIVVGDCQSTDSSSSGFLYQFFWRVLSVRAGGVGVEINSHRGNSFLIEKEKRTEYRPFFMVMWSVNLQTLRFLCRCLCGRETALADSLQQLEALCCGASQSDRWFHSAVPRRESCSLPTHP